MMKYSIFVLATLLMGMLLIGMAYAEEGSGNSGSGSQNSGSDDDDSDSDSDDSSDDSTSTSDVLNSIPDISDDDLLEQELEIEDDISGKRVRAAQGFYGQGYAVNEDVGHFVRIVGVHKTAISLENERVVRSFTAARLGIGRETYKLERSSTNLEEDLPAGTMTFTVIKGSNNVGELDLTITKKYPNGFVIRTGTLELVDGTEWDITVGMRATPIKGALRADSAEARPVVAAEVKSASNSDSTVVSATGDVEVVEPRDIAPAESARKRGFFARLFGWGEDRSGSNSGPQ